MVNPAANGSSRADHGVSTDGSKGMVRTAADVANGAASKGTLWGLRVGSQWRSERAQGQF